MALHTRTTRSVRLCLRRQLRRCLTTLSDLMMHTHVCLQQGAVLLCLHCMYIPLRH